jgi:predicted outer membrane protein
MNTNRKRIASGAVSVALVGGIVAAALTLGPAFAASQPAPAPTSTFDPASFSEFRETVDDAIAEAERVAAEAAAAEAARVEAERVAAEAAAAEAARVEAERVAAEQAAAEQAARDAAARQAPAPQAPAPQAPAAPAQPGGDQQAGECREFNDAGECTAVYVP